ncbi:MAG: integrin alpha [Phycisphaerae bacterium]
MKLCTATIVVAITTFFFPASTPRCAAQCGLAQTVSSDAESRWFGQTVTDVGDVNGDGFGDLAVGDPGWPDYLDERGRILLLSGADWSVLQDIRGDSPFLRLGNVVRPAGDVDSDGRQDVLTSSASPQPGFASVYSGRTGQRLIHFVGHPDDSIEFGMESASVGDLDGDAVPDFAVADPREYVWDLPWSAQGVVYVYSGRTGAALYHVKLHSTEQVDNRDLGLRIRPMGDYDFDGFADFFVLLGDRYHDAGQHESHFLIVSGSTGTIVQDLGMMPLMNSDPSVVTVVDDIDGDQRRDIVALVSPDQDSMLRAYSSATGQVLWEVPRELDWYFTAGIENVGRLDHDQFADVGVAAVGLAAGGPLVLGYSGLDGRLLCRWIGVNYAPIDAGFGASISGLERTVGNISSHAVVGAPYDRTNDDKGRLFVFKSACDGHIRGDSNGDGAVNNFDVDAFVLALAAPQDYLAEYPNCDLWCNNDITRDGLLNNFDVDPFIECVLLGGCP